MHSDRIEMDDAFGHWLAGFVDGEGCFCITCSSNGTARMCTLNVALRSDDKPLLEEIQRQTGLGKIYDSPGRGRTKPYTRWIVQAQPEAQAIVDLFSRYPLRGKKAMDFAIWKEAVAIMCAHRNRPTPTRNAALDQLKADLQAGRAYIA